MPSIHLPAARQRTLVRFREGAHTLGRQDQTGTGGGGSYRARGAKWTARSLRTFGSPAPGDIDEVVRLMHDAAAWMSAKGTPAWDVARMTGHSRRPSSWIRAPSRELQRDGIVGCCTLSAEDPGLARRPLGGRVSAQAPAVRRTHAGRCQLRADRELRRHAARTQKCAKAARLDCHPNLQPRNLYERLGFTHVDTFNPWHQDPTFIAERLELEILTSVRASRSMSGWDGPVASRSLAVRPRCLHCARGCRYPPLPSSTLDNAAAVIAADARAGLFACQALLGLQPAWGADLRRTD